MNRRATETGLPTPGCPQAVNAAAWAVGELDLDAQRAYRKHLERCPFCAAEMLALQKTVAQLREWLLRNA